jgi:hypothetical protein
MCPYLLIGVAILYTLLVLNFGRAEVLDYMTVCNILYKITMVGLKLD